MTEFTLPEEVYDDLVNFVYSREQDIRADIENFGMLKRVLAWIDSWESSPANLSTEVEADDISEF